MCKSHNVIVPQGDTTSNILADAMTYMKYALVLVLLLVCTHAVLSACPDWSTVSEAKVSTFSEDCGDDCGGETMEKGTMSVSGDGEYDSVEVYCIKPIWNSHETTPPEI